MAEGMWVLSKINSFGVSSARMGDRVHVRGMYEWNDLGGLVHWTHLDPQGVEDGGWVRYRRRDYM